MGPVLYENLSLGVYDQVRLNLSCSASDTRWNIERGMCIKRLFWPPYEVKK